MYRLRAQPYGIDNVNIVVAGAMYLVADAMEVVFQRKYVQKFLENSLRPQWCGCGRNGTITIVTVTVAGATEMAAAARAIVFRWKFAGKFPRNSLRPQ